MDGYPEYHLDIAGGRYGHGRGVFIIAEIGTAHGGDIGKARELIDAAADSGADCAKFQMVFADEILHPFTGPVRLPGGDIDLYRTFKALELDQPFFDEAARHCEDRSVFFLCTPFGIASARILRSMGVGALKIASPELNHLPLLTEAAGYGIPLILSTGVSTLSDIELALATVGPAHSLMHCVTAYPAPEEEYNLRLIPLLSSLFAVPVGLSDHSRNPVLVPTLAAALGAPMIEKHITLGKADGGLDDPIALDPAEFAELATSVRETAGETPAETVDRMSAVYGADRVRLVLGTGAKRLAESESANYRTTNRSIMARRTIPSGEVIAESDVGLYRSEKNLTPGLHPRYLSLVIGSRVVRRIEDGAGIDWDDIR